MTEWYWSGSLDAFADMCNLRCASDTQYETRLVARSIGDQMKRLFPVSWPELVKVNGYQKEKLEDINKWEDANPVNQAWYDGDGGELFE
jgi:thymidylate synthase ThyX